jgi:crossover junction endodeoxyribonuclease RuvC
LHGLIDKYNPSKAVIEKLYFENNSKTAIDVAGARGAIIYILKTR